MLSWHCLQRDSTGEEMNALQLPLWSSRWWTIVAALTWLSCKHAAQSGYFRSWCSRRLRHCIVWYIQSYPPSFSLSRLPSDHVRRISVLQALLPAFRQRLRINIVQDLAVAMATMSHEEFQAGCNVAASHVPHHLFRIAMDTWPAVAKDYGALVAASRVQG